MIRGVDRDSGAEIGTPADQSANVTSVFAYIYLLSIFLVYLVYNISSKSILLKYRQEL
jgi:hypothetical protein